MKVSIITATYNSSTTIRASLESVNAQTYKNIEHIFIDGCSEDNTVQIIEAFSRRKTALLSEKDNGIYDALNKGINLATGDLVLFLHSDDILNDPDVLTDLVKAYKSNDQINGIYGNINFISNMEDLTVIRQWKSSQYCKFKLISGWMPPHTAMLIEASQFKKLGNFDISYKISGDYDFILRLFKSGANLSYVDRLVTNMSVGGKSTEFSFQSFILKFHEDVKALTANKFYFPILAALLKRISKVGQFLKYKGLNLTLILALLILFLSLNSTDIAVDTKPLVSDKLLHLFFYFLMVLPVSLERIFSHFTVFVFAMTFGGCIELIQPFWGREADITDFLANAMGIILGILVARVIKFIFEIQQKKVLTD